MCVCVCVLSAYILRMVFMRFGVLYYNLYYMFFYN